MMMWSVYGSISNPFSDDSNGDEDEECDKKPQEKAETLAKDRDLAVRQCRKYSTTQRDPATGTPSIYH